MSVILPAPVYDYVSSFAHLPHAELAVIHDEGVRQGIPVVDPQSGALLHALVRAARARRVLEIGTAVGYSGLWMATALPPDGMLITLERDRARAEIARGHFTAAGVANRVTVMVGDASQYLHKVAGPFDVIFQDGDKASYTPLLDRLVTLLRPGGVLVTDNVLWSGRVAPGFAQAGSADDNTPAIVEYNQRVASHPDLLTAVVPLRDGVSISVKRS